MDRNTSKCPNLASAIKGNTCLIRGKRKLDVQDGKKAETKTKKEIRSCFVLLERMGTGERKTISEAMESLCEESAAMAITGATLAEQSGTGVAALDRSSNECPVQGEKSGKALEVTNSSVSKYPDLVSAV